MFHTHHLPLEYATPSETCYLSPHCPLSSLTLCSGLTVVSGTGPGVEWSPVIHMQLKGAGGAGAGAGGKKGAADHPSAGGRLSESEARQQTSTLRRVADVAFAKYGVLVSVPMYSCLDRVRPTPSLRLMVPAMLNEKEVAAVVAAIKAAAKEVLAVA